MKKIGIDSEIEAANQELSALLEKHINAPVRQSIEQVSESLSMTLKDDFDAKVTGLRSEVRKINGCFEELNDSIDGVARKISDAQATLQEQIQVAFSEAEQRQVVSLTASEDRLSKLSQTQLHHLNGAINSFSSQIQEQHITFSGLLSSVTSAEQKHELLVQKATKQLLVSFSEAEQQQAIRLTAVEGRLGKQGQTQLHHLKEVINSLYSQSHEHHVTSQATLDEIMSQLDALMKAASANKECDILVRKMTKRWFVWLLGGVAANLIAVGIVLYFSLFG